MTNNSTFEGCTLVTTGHFISVSIGTFICFLIALENAVGMITIWRTPSLHTNANRLIFSLAITDLIVAVTFLLSGIFKLPKLNSVLPHIIDVFLFAITASMVVLSCLHMSIIAVERYLYIAHPFYYIRNVTKLCMRNVLLITWAIGLILLVVPLILYTDATYDVLCIFLYPPIEYYAVCLVSYPVSFVVVFVFYLKIALLAYKRKKASTARALGHATNIREESKSDPIRNVPTPALKSVKFFMTMFGAFSIFTIPPVITTAVNLFRHFNFGFYGFILYLFVINSGSSFILYAKMNKEFSEALKKTFTDWSKCCRKERDFT